MRLTYASFWGFLVAKYYLELKKMPQAFYPVEMNPRSANQK